MLRNKNIICISSIDWDFIWQGHQEIMSVMARNGNRVLFIENTGVRAPNFSDADRIWKRFLNWKKGYKGIRKLNENLYVYSPLVLPFPYSRIAVNINKFLMLSVMKRWMGAMAFHNPIVWSFLPTPIVSDMLGSLDPSIFIYYCIDDFVSSSKGAAKITSAEKEIIKKADMVFTTSHALYDRCRAINTSTYLFPFGVSVDNYNKARESQIKMPEELRSVRKPILGYVGGLHKWIDIELVKRIAAARRDISVVMVGPKQTDLCGLDKFENVFVLGKKEIHELPNYVKFFDAGLIPYKLTKYTENVYPTKINEYLAMAKPVISTRIPEVVEFDKANGGDFIYFIENGSEPTIDKALSEKKTKELENKRIDIANGNSWAVKIDQMCDLIEVKMQEMELGINQNWLDRFRHLYKKMQSRAINIVALAALTYILLFHTPFIWFVASPLKIAQAPQKADAIVVFGGGVGETGSPGKSTIERARFSVDLYKAGLAKYIIYSSGYTYKYNDAENMRLFAMSMGVPEKNIILEKKANSAYENVKYTDKILKEKGFNRIILVSSPYNMLRASLVFKHAAKDIDVIYSPVPEPEFYLRHKKVRIDQMEAILHEYMGIAYYFLKGYI